LGNLFTIKPKSIGPPTQYLGNKVSEVTLENGTRCWSFSYSQYVQNAISNVETHLKFRGAKLPTRSKSPWSTDYRPEIDTTPKLEPEEASYYQSLRFILNNATKEYSTVITSLESSGKGKDVNTIQEAFEKHWEKNYKGKGKKEEAFNIEYKFKGKCNYCGITGHKEAEC
jgi:hypothetical protein